MQKREINICTGGFDFAASVAFRRQSDHLGTLPNACLFSCLFNAIVISGKQRGFEKTHSNHHGVEHASEHIHNHIPSVVVYPQYGRS